MWRVQVILSAPDRSGRPSCSQGSIVLITPLFGVTQGGKWEKPVSSLPFIKKKTPQKNRGVVQIVDPIRGHSRRIVVASARLLGREPIHDC